MGIKPQIELFLRNNVLYPIQSPWSTPIFPAPKPDGSWRFVHSLRETSTQIQPLYSVVANPYTLLTTLSSDQMWYTVTDLKDALFCIPLAKESQPYFAFEWEDPQMPTYLYSTSPKLLQ